MKKLVFALVVLFLFACNSEPKKQAPIDLNDTTAILFEGKSIGGGGIVTERHVWVRTAEDTLKEVWGYGPNGLRISGGSGVSISGDGKDLWDHDTTIYQTYHDVDLVCVFCLKEKKQVLQTLHKQGSYR